MERNKEFEIKKRLKLFLKEDNLVEEYIKRYGYVIDIKKINEIRNNKNAIGNSRSIINSIPINHPDNPLYEIELKCPVCHSTLKGYNLKSKSLIVKYNWFMVPFYEKNKNYIYIDYLIYNVSVCPKCLFASPDERDFEKYNKYANSYSKSAIPFNMLLKLKDTQPEREQIIEYLEDTEKVFSYPRDIKAGILSYKLAINRADYEIEFNLPNAHFKKGGYLLRLATLMEKNNEKEEDIKNCYQEALDAFKEAFKLSNFSSKEAEFYNLYLIVVLSIYLDDLKSAQEYLHFFDKAKEEIDKEEDIKVYEKWYKRAKEAFDYRDVKDIFNKPR